MLMDGVRLGLIGYGAWGAHHARAIASIPGAKLVAIAANSAESCRRAQAEHPTVAVVADYRELLARGDVDAVDVVLPSHLHHAVAGDVLHSGRHLLLEKPMCLDLAHCDELISLARERSRVIALGHELRVSSLWGRVKTLVESGTIGEPLHVLVELWRKPYRLGSGGWRYDPARVGDWILEEPIHFFDLARWYLAGAGNPVSVYAAASSKRPDQPGLSDNFSAIVQFPRNRYAVVTQTLAGWEHHQSVKLTGTTGAIWATWSGAMDRTFTPTFRLRVMRGEEIADEPVVAPAGEVYELVSQIERFIASIRTGVPPACTGEDGRWAVAMCLKARESLTAGQPILFPEA